MSSTRDMKVSRYNITTGITL